MGLFKTKMILLWVFHALKKKDDYGKYYHLDIFIKNLSETPIVFQPDSVHSNLLTKKDDTLKF